MPMGRPRPLHGPVRMQGGVQLGLEPGLEVYHGTHARREDRSGRVQVASVSGRVIIASFASPTKKSTLQTVRCSSTADPLPTPIHCLNLTLTLTHPPQGSPSGPCLRRVRTLVTATRSIYMGQGSYTWGWSPQPDLLIADPMYCISA